jgi:hypothetical protein
VTLLLANAPVVSVHDDERGFVCVERDATGTVKPRTGSDAISETSGRRGAASQGEQLAVGGVDAHDCVFRRDVEECAVAATTLVEDDAPGVSELRGCVSWYAACEGSDSVAAGVAVAVVGACEV